MAEAAGRRLPIYLVLDCSGSMAGDPIESVRQGLKALLADLKGDPLALETAYLSVITFHSTAQQVVPLTELSVFQEPNLDASGTTAYGAALTLLEQSLDREVRKSTENQKGDYKPLIFIMSDGHATDEWTNPAEKIKRKRVGNIIACAAGQQADETMLKATTEIVLRLSSLQPDDLKKFFKWVSSSIKTTSQSVNNSPDAPINLPPPPPQIQIVP